MTTTECKIIPYLQYPKLTLKILWVKCECFYLKIWIFILEHQNKMLRQSVEKRMNKLEKLKNNRSQL